MIRMKTLGINWNKLDPFPTYSPGDFPIFAPIVPPVVAPALYNYPVITEPAPVVEAPATSIPNWVLLGGAVLAGVALSQLLLRKKKS